MREAIKRERRGKLRRGVLLQHDNARPYVSSKTVAAIRELGFECLPHPPYSPDLAPSDYWHMLGPICKGVTCNIEYFLKLEVNKCFINLMSLIYCIEILQLNTGPAEAVIRVVRLLA